MTLKDPVCGKTVEVTMTESEHRLNIRQAFCSTACMRAYHDLQQLRFKELAAVRANVRTDCRLA